MSHFLTVGKTAKYEIFGEIDKAEILIFALHGYGQLVQYFIKNFHQIDKKIAVIAPEGLHRFYLTGSSGRVGASWMTKEERETDISDNLMYLNSLYNHFYLQDKKIVLLGFSQGGATAARWFAHSPKLFHHLIMWATVFPPDIEMSLITSTRDKHYFVLGDNDIYFNAFEAEKIITFYEAKGFNCIRFNGDHSIHSETLNLILHQISTMK